MILRSCVSRTKDTSRTTIIKWATSLRKSNLYSIIGERGAAKGLCSSASDSVRRYEKGCNRGLPEKFRAVPDGIQFLGPAGSGGSFRGKTTGPALNTRVA